MEISLSEEHAYYFVPQLTPEIARDRIEKKKTTLVAGMFGTLARRISRRFRSNSGWSRSGW